MKKTLIIAWIATLALAGSIWTIVNAQSAKTIWTAVKTQFSNHFGTGGTWWNFKWMKNNKPKMTTEQITAIQTAIKNNDYNAFTAAQWTGNSGAKIITNEQFTDMVTKYNKNLAKETAIDNNDYNAFLTATTPTKEEFAAIVLKKKEQKAKQTAITNNDYDAFVAALNSDTNKPADAKVPTKEEFAKIVERSKNMPTDGGMMFGFWRWDHKGWPKGWFGGGEKPEDK